MPCPVVSLSLLVLGAGLPGVVPADSPSQLLFPTIVLFSSSLFYLGLGLAYADAFRRLLTAASIAANMMPLARWQLSVPPYAMR
ncbi:MAG: hypothetical protein E6I91_09740 [Chloroflexi bacterium]|nr:MAG: hypothetical protein E6I91_09740 [Chloroflexota bacterium]